MASFSAKAEYRTLKKVMVHTPGYESFLGTLDPNANLFIKGFSVIKAQKEHQLLMDTLRGEGIKAYLLKDLVAKHPRFDMAVLESVDVSQYDQGERFYLIDNLMSMDDDSKFRAILLNPRLSRKEVLKRMGGEASFIMNRIPLANMYFQRDQQFLGDKGFILSRMAKPSRKKEPRITKLALESLGANIQYEVKKPDAIEGGEFMPLGEFALIGTGYYDPVLKRVYGRTTRGAIDQILRNKAIGYDEVGVVTAPITVGDEVNVSGRVTEMELMHLDTWFNVPAKGYAVTCPKLVSSARVEVYTKDGGEYVKQRELTFEKYLAEKGYNIIPITMAEQSFSASNFLTLRDKKVMGINLKTKLPSSKLFKKMRKEGIDVVPDGEGLNLDNLTDGYGGARCMTCPLQRN